MSRFADTLLASRLTCTNTQQDVRANPSRDGDAKPPVCRILGQELKIAGLPTEDRPQGALSSYPTLSSSEADLVRPIEAMFGQQVQAKDSDDTNKNVSSA